jgi:hypothetical protein
MTLQAVKGGWVRMRKTVVHHWRFENGVDPINPGNPFGETVMPRGWYCWVYPEDNHKFEDWMAKNCPTTDCTHRFNSGDPMYTIYIKDDTEAMIFNLRWM